MSKIPEISSEDQQLFLDAIGKVKPMVQDKVEPVKKSIKKPAKIAENASKNAHSFYFSDQFQAHFPEQGPIRYVRAGENSYLTKQLRRGDYTPELILDLHGLTQNQAKSEIAALLHACQKEHVDCVNIIHGLGSHVLKTRVPNWLVQHPDIRAFHQAPLEWGGAGALLVLVDIKLES